MLYVGVYKTLNGNLGQVFDYSADQAFDEYLRVQVVMSILAEDLIGSLRAQRVDEPGIDGNRTGCAHPWMSHPAL